MLAEAPRAPLPPFNSAISSLATRLVPVRDTGPVIGDILTSNSGFRTVVNENASPGLNVYRGVTDQFVEGTGTAKVTMPADAFIHSKQEAVVKLEAKQVDNSNLPSWVKFDSQTGSFEVNAPANFKGKIDVKVNARDDDGREATVIFRIFVGEQPAGDNPAGKPQGQQGRISLSEKLRMAVKRNAMVVKTAGAAPIVIELPVVTASNNRASVDTLH